MFEQFKTIADGMFTPDDRILLAVSGGVDSMVMLALFCRTNYHFAVAHCNFSLRGEESDGDTELVVDYCAAQGILLHTVRFDTYAEMARSGDSLQMAARKLRYDWFGELAEKHGYTKIAIAHNSGDTIETFFINLLRGTGVRGLAGIAVARERIVRPLMTFSRPMIEQYAVFHKIPWRNDSSNNGTKYLRNKLRHIVLPQLREIESDFDAVMLADMGRVTDAVSFIDRMIGEIRDKSTSLYRGRTTIALSVVAQYEPYHFVLYELLSPYGFNATQVAEIVSAGDGCSRFVSECYEGVLSRGLFIISPRDFVDRRGERVIEILGKDDDFMFDLLPVGAVASFSPSSAYFDADKIIFPLTVRSWHEGDFFVPFGMTGRKKLSDFFVDSKISVIDKQDVLLLVNGNGDIL
ncbi:MAG: tRNA lysidine(34) synthetase TilS, partial [Rikenellaceae bacterium]